MEIRGDDGGKDGWVELPPLPASPSSPCKWMLEGLELELSKACGTLTPASGNGLVNCSSKNFCEGHDFLAASETRALASEHGDHRPKRIL